MSSILDLAISISLADHISSGVKSIIGQFKLMENATADVQKKMDGFKNMAFVGAAFGAVGAAGVAALSELAKKAGEVEMQMIQLGGVYGLNIDSSQLKEVESLAQEMSQKTIFSKKENLGISLELAHAGISKEALQKVVPEATYLSEIEVGMGKSSGAHQSAYNFARMAEDAGITNNTERMAKFADEMYRVISITHASSQSLGEAFKYSMPVVKNLGWTEQDNLLATAMAARAGVEGSMAGTHIKDFAERINPFKYLGTKGGDKQLSAMMDAGLLGGVTTREKQGGGVQISGFETAALLKDKDHLKSYAEMVDILSEKHAEFIKKGSSTDWVAQTSEADLKHIQELAKAQTGKELSGGDLQWAAIMNHIFGEQGQDFAIISSHKEMFTKLKEQMDIQKDLHQQIDVIRKSFVGQSHILHGQVETLGLQFGKPIMEMLVPAMNMLSTAMGGVLKWFDQHPQISKFLAILAAGVSTFFLVGGAITVTIAAFGALTTALSVIGIGFGTVALLSGGVVIGIAAIATGAYLIVKNWGTIKTFLSGVFETIKTSMSSVLNKAMEVWPKIDTYVEVFAGTITGLLIPTMVRMGVVALATASRTLVSWLFMGAQAIAGGAIFAAQSAFIVGRWVWMGIQSMLQAGRMAIAWIIALGPIAWITAAVIAIGILIYKNWDTIKAKTIEIWGVVAKFLGDSWDWIKEKASGLWSSIKSFFVDGWNQIMDTASSWMDSAKQWGKNIVDGLINGIKDAWGNLKKVVGELWDKFIVDPFTKKGDIHSPSREMMKQGNYVTQGLAIGIMNEAGLVKRASESLFDVIPTNGRGGSGISVNKPASVSGGGGLLVQGPLIGEIHQQPGESTDDLVERIARKVERIMDSRSQRATLTIGSRGLQRGY